MATDVYGAQDKVTKTGDTMTGTLTAEGTPSVAATSAVTAGVDALTYSSTITINAASGNHFRVTLTGTALLATPTGGADGQKITVEVIQDGTGSRTLTYSGGFSFGAAGHPILSTAAAKRDFLGFIYNASTNLWYFVGAALGF